MAYQAVLAHPRVGDSCGLGYGGDYNPEQWDEDTWREDVALMRRAGVTFVTVGVFSWARLEPTPGVLDFGWLDRVLDLLDAHDIGVDLATATASPPAWLVRRHPDVLPVDARGTRLGFGGRQAWCPSSPVYREAALALVESIAERYSSHPALCLWHVSNELGCHNAHCYCDVSAEAFRRWLRRKYDDLATLNDAWGTSFWSQAYSAWDQIEPPRTPTAIPNPAQQLDFRRFSSDELLDHHRAERDVLRRHSEHPVTTNFMVTEHIDGLDYWRWAPEQDVVSNDHYLDGRRKEPHVELSLCADWTRGLAAGQSWVLMEHSPSAVNWQTRNYPKAPGEMRRNTLQHVARGADSVGFFQWRASRAGAEKYHSAMLPHAGTDSRLWREVVELGGTLHRLGEVAGTSVVADVALLTDYECWWATQRPALPSSDLAYFETLLEMYDALWRGGVTVDVRHPSHDLSPYRLVVAPMLHLVHDRDARRLQEYVHGGGHFLTTYFSGTVDERDHVRLGGYPGAFRELCGIRVEEFVPLRPGVKVRLDPSGSADAWVEDVHLDGAEAVLRCADGPVAGAPVLTRHAHGEGTAWYLAARTDATTTRSITDQVLQVAGVTGAGTPEGVEVVHRVGPDRTYAFVINHTGEQVALPMAGHDLVTDRSLEAGSGLPPGEVACLRLGEV